jgi:DNA repair protein RecO (recombination protein O)
MTEWQDEGIILSARPHGESSLVLSALTKEHGRFAGYVKGGHSAKMRGIYQPGNYVNLRWWGRIEDQLGAYQVELIENLSAPFFDEPLKLKAVGAICAMADATLSERFPLPHIYEGVKTILKLMGDLDDWPVLYAKWELSLLDALGFGFDFDKCAVCGRQDNLIYVSPKTGRAVCETDGEPYKAKLFALSSFLKGQQHCSQQEMIDVLKMTGFFLNNNVFIHLKDGEPFLRSEFMRAYEKKYG